MLNTNEYFDGKVKSIAFKNSQLESTVGVMTVGEYTFSTSKKETMSVVSGELIVRLPSDDAWQRFGPNQSFVVAANASFDLQVEVETAYLCTYE